jgi:dolichol-phosphate mannosyltransferase
MSNICVVIPTYQEAENLPVLLHELEGLLLKEDVTIIVVDDNSGDGTAEIAEKLNSHYKNIVVCKRKGRLGIGTAIRDGLQIALSSPECEYFVTMDADFSHSPDDVEQLLREAPGYDIIQGSRYIKGGKILRWSFLRKATSLAANSMCKLLFRTRIHDHTSFFRVYSRRCAETLASVRQYDSYEWGIASLLIAIEMSYKIKEVPITFVNRENGKSKLNIAYILKWLHSISELFLERTLTSSTITEHDYPKPACLQ